MIKMLTKLVRWASRWAWQKEIKFMDTSVELEYMTMDEKSFEAKAIMNPGLAQMMAHAFAEQAFNTPNYVEMQFQPRAVKHRDKWIMVTVTVQKHDGKTPHELRMEAERRVAVLQVELDAIRKRIP